MPALLDITVLESLRAISGAGKVDLLSQLVEIFILETPEQLAAIERAMAGNDLETCAREAHSLKSTSATLGAMALSQRCQDIEQACRECDSLRASAAVAGLDEAWHDVVELLPVVAGKAA